MVNTSYTIKKFLIFVIFVLIINITIFPSIIAISEEEITKTLINQNSDKTFKIIVTRYKADGSIEKTKVLMPKGKALELQKNYRDIDNSEERFSLLKMYGVIPENVSLDSLKKEMLTLAEKLNVTEEKIESIYERYTCKNYDTRLFGVNFLNRVHGVSFITINLPIGLSLIMGLINYYRNSFSLPSIDLMYNVINFFGVYYFFDGILPEFNNQPFGVIALIGFIGYVISIPFISPIAGLEGFTVASFALPVLMGPPP